MRHAGTVPARLAVVGGLFAAAMLIVGAAAPAAHHDASSRAAPPPINHVFLIVLENQGYDTTFGPTTVAHYLADTMVSSGAILRQYYGIGHVSLPNYIAMISGLAPNPATQRDCGMHAEFAQTGMGDHGQPIGEGCVFPAKIKTIANQFADRRLKWAGYMEDLGKNPLREPATCGNVPIGAFDVTERATPADQYAAKHNPFVYFHAVIDSPMCGASIVPIGQLESDLKSAKTTPAFAFITPNLCHDGHDRPCADSEPGGLVSADRFLSHWVPIIEHSPAFRDGGLLIVTFDEALTYDASACCKEPSGPNTPRPGVHGPGGGRIGAVLVSPFIEPGTVSEVPYNHYSMLRSIEDLFGFSHLGYAASSGLKSFGADVYTRQRGQ